MPAQQHQAREAIGTGHVQVEQHQIPVGLGNQPFFQLRNTCRFHQIGFAAQPLAQRLKQSATKQRVIVGYEDFVGSHEMSLFFIWVLADDQG
ncbi:hypothetical protein D3C77_667850 [compost metagenome]